MNTKTKQPGKDKPEGRKLVSLLKAFSTQAASKQEQGDERTAKNYRSTITKIRSFLQTWKEGGKTRLCDIDTGWVQEFNAWLATLHHDNPSTVGFYLSNLRAMYNRAVEQGETSYPATGYPFAQTSIKVAAPFKRALPQEEVQRLGDKGLYERLTVRCRQSLDLFLFMLFCQGISFQDAYNLTYGHLNHSGYIIYIRSKTGSQLKVKLTDEMRHILSRYRLADCTYLFPFPFLHERRRGATTDMNLGEDSALKRTNRHLKQIGELLGTEIPLTTYVMRHTFATLMLASGAAVELISQCLGHTSIKTTQIYLSKLPTEQIDRATENMLDLCVRTTTEKETITPTPQPVKKKAQTNPKESSEGTIPFTVKNQTDYEIRETDKKECPFLTKKRTLWEEFPIQLGANLSKFHYLSKIKVKFFLSALPELCYTMLRHVSGN